MDRCRHDYYARCDDWKGCDSWNWITGTSNLDDNAIYFGRPARLYKKL